MLSNGQDVVGALCARDFKGVGSQFVDEGKVVLDEETYIVRRLTPLECERLMGFPDNHTDVADSDPEQVFSRMPQWQQADEKGKAAIERKVRRWCRECPDGPRYKAIGNSFAVPVVRWIGERIQEVDALFSCEGSDETT